MICNPESNNNGNHLLIRMKNRKVNQSEDEVGGTNKEVWCPAVGGPVCDIFKY
jgi:hypothetical protein